MSLILRMLKPNTVETIPVMGRPGSLPMHLGDRSGEVRKIGASMDQTDVTRKLVELNHRIGAAEITQDRDFMRTVLADDLRFRRAGGTIIDKARYLTDLTNKENTTVQNDSEDIEVSVAEETAVVSLVVHAEGTRGDKPMKGNYRNVRVFRKDPDGWKLTIWVNTEIGGAN